MKLSELNPRWVGLTNWESDNIFYIGISFDSPLKSGQRLAILFEPPIDPNNMAARYGIGNIFPDRRHWQRTGDSIANLTLKPSIDFSDHKEWHGFITNGEVT